MKVATKKVNRPLVDVLGRPDLLNAAVVVNGDAAAHRQCLFLIVGNVEDGMAHFLADVDDLDLHRFAQLAVEGAERLVHQQQAWAEHQGSS